MVREVVLVTGCVYVHERREAPNARKVTIAVNTASSFAQEQQRAQDAQVQDAAELQVKWMGLTKGSAPKTPLHLQVLQFHAAPGKWATKI